ncbi:sucrose transport protein SUC3 isoform X2 [Olea europaea var. sylvestris]|uniref:sucrose transport protein SUC3 isoform X2 n=1 Tax=Olea europaea var. sylvestris TaxID=158386 RepID=UPI000C1CE174|nr:sucrose transport protein SUC3 isoform X2 [Olea europaea var. sylvestris]
MDAVSIRVPYKNLRQEVELVGVDESELRRLQTHSFNSSSSPSRISDSGETPPDSNQSRNVEPPKNCSLITLILSCTVAAGVQFGWALQLSLLTPYIQVQPFVGIWSDKCSSKYGRRRPFIFVGSLMISVAVIIIGFSADIGYLLGDTKEHCSTFKGTRSRAAIIFIIGFWMLDLANNTVQGPARALLADLSGPDQRNSANAIFCSWMAVGNILGFSAGASGNWHRWFPFLTNRACCEPCGNLKAAFLVAVVFLTLCTLVTLYFAKEVPLVPKQHHRPSDSAPLLNDPEENGSDILKSKTDTKSMDNSPGSKAVRDYAMDNNFRNQGLKDGEDHDENFNDSPSAVLVNLLTSLRHLPPAMHSVLIVMALTWTSWFPFFLFDTDWMGREVFHGDPKGDVSEVQAYNEGVREGAFGLILNSVVLGISSFFIEPMCQWMGARLVWAASNFIVFACMAGTALIGFVSVRQSSEGVQHVIGANGATKIASLVVFALLGLPLSVTYSVPFSVTAELTADSGGGQGLAIGVLNLAIVLPQMIVSLGAGPWDQLFGGGNIPAFVLASVSAMAAGVIAINRLPTLDSSSYKSTGFHFG